MTLLALALLLLGPAQTISGKYVRHSPEYAGARPVAIPQVPGPLPEGVEELCRLIEGGNETAPLFSALGVALLRRGESALAFRAFDRAHRLGHPDAAWLVARKDECGHVPEGRIRAEEQEAREWVRELQNFERRQLAQGGDPDDLEEFYTYYGRPEENMYTHIRVRRLSFAGGIAGILVGVACLVACRAVPRRAALLPALVAGALFLAPSAFGQTGLFLHGAAVAAAGAAATLLFGRKAA